MNRLRSLSRTRRATVMAGAFAVALLLAAAGVAVAGSGVSIVDSGGQFHFQPNHISVNVGSSVTWTDNTDAPHTISSDVSTGPLNGSVSPTGTYQATFNTAGDFAYHCNIHTYMHGTVHVAALPPTDTVSAASNTGVLVGLSAVGSLLLITGLAVPLRRREERA